MKKENYGRYMNLLTDYAFKKIFGTEKNKALLIAFLNEIVPHRETIVDVQYLPTEQLGNIEGNRRAFFDLYCIDEKGKRYIIEMQIGRQEHFMSRSLFYSTFPLQAQAKKGKWNFELKPLYHIAILNFSMYDDDSCVGHIYLVRKENNEKVSEVLNFIVVELPKFKKEIKDLQTKLDCWLYSFRNLSTLEAQPPEMRGEIFDRLFAAADTNKLTTMEQKAYNKSIAKDFHVQLIADYSRKEGEARGKAIGEAKGILKGEARGEARGMRKGILKGMQKGILKGEARGKREGERLGMKQKAITVAEISLKEGFPVKLVAKLSGLTVQQVNSIIKEQSK